ncbi:hypothetical protein L21SP5_02215 [Salinivirga cyanobacteriivorans]|uniref:Secretion system C-terminal sorting domain-containing protein n=2 Tax=Salinivirga cyanobacteriivorans TaxID=1307839 RepID=A0A0S2I0G5_9BACT|nr:hypothetical protein L21SP5_02215 [Salinivirga cyanobacteriivorans]
MKSLMLLAAFIWPALSAMGQTTVDFETADAGYTPSITDGSGNTDVFNRTDVGVGTNTTFYWAAEDLTVTDPSITLDQIDVSGNTAFNFSVDLLTPNSNDWDVSDEVLITYSLDGGASQNLMWIQSNDDGDDYNAPAAIDADFDGTGDDGSELPAVTDDFGAGVGDDFETFTTPDIALSGNTTLDITIQFVELTSADEGIYMDNITITATGGTPDPEPTNHVADFTATADDAANITLTWTDNDGTQPADAFLLKANTGAITAPADGTEEADDTDLSDGAGAINVASGVGTYTFSNLEGATTYNFEIYPYTNSGADIDFKTDGTVPATSATTLEGTIDWANLQWPDAGTITQGEEYNVYAQVYKAGVTDAAGQGAGIEAWLGYSTEDTDPSTWTNWVPATYNTDDGDNDEYMADLGAEVPVGDFFYASRFQLNGGDYYYGGYNSGGGGAWDGTTNVSGTLIVERPMATIPYSATFDADLGDMYTYSVSGDTKQWYHDGGDQAAAMNGFGSGETEEDWMIFPGIDLSVKANEIVTFETWYNYGSDDANNYLKLMYSTDYAGTGDPSGATWTELTYTQPGASETWAGSGDVDLSAIDGASVYIAFKYHYESGSYRFWKIDNISVAEAPVGEAPVVQNIVATPDAPTSSDAVSISADVTDADGTIASVELNWGTTSGTLDQNITMSNATDDTYVTDSDIPAQADGTTVYYEIVAEDNDANVTTTSEMMYEVFDPTSATLPYVNVFDADLGDMYTYSVVGDQGWFQDEFDGATYAKMSGYSGSAQENEDWLISPAFDFSALTDIKMQFDEAINYANVDVNTNHKVFVSTDYAGVGDPSAATWAEISVTNRATGSSWDFVTVDPISLSTYAGEASVHIGFKYTSTTSEAATWEIDSVVVEEGIAMPAPAISNVMITPDAPTSSDAVSVAADVTDADGTIDSVALVWGLAAGTPEDTVNMTLSTGDTYVADTDIPAQADGTTVYYHVVAIDNDMQETATAEMMYDVYDPVVVTLPYSNDFADGTFGDLTTYSVVGDQVWEVAAYGNPEPGAKVTGYDGGNYTNEDWMITPAIDMSAVTAAKMVFDEAINYANIINDEQEVMVSTDYSGSGDPSAATWIEVPVSGRSAGDNWDFVTVNEIDLTAYAGEASVHVAFKYTSTDSEGATWEIDNILIEEGQALVAPVIENITLTPEQPTSSDAVSVSATITDGDGTIDAATLHWGTDVFYGNTINMSVSSGDTYVTDSDIPAQEDGTMIFYKIVATDNDANETSSDDLAYWAFDPYAGTLPFYEPFYYDLSVMEAVSAVGDQTWNHDSYGYAKMSGYSGGAVENEDWLITPSLDLSAVEGATFVYDEAINYGGTIDDEQEVMISTDYDGAGDPSTATWAELTITNRPAGDSWDFVTVDEVDLADYVGEANVYIAFAYTSTTSNAATWEVDNISVSAADGIIFNSPQDLTVYPNPAQNTLFVNGFNGDAQVDIISMDGKVVMNKQIESNRVDVASLNEGLYIIRITNNNEVYTTRFVKE